MTEKEFIEKEAIKCVNNYGSWNENDEVSHANAIEIFKEAYELGKNGCFQKVIFREEFDSIPYATNHRPYMSKNETINISEGY